MEDKRSNVDFSKHVITTIQSFEGYKNIFKFADPETSFYAITFINCCGVMAVTGDCGNWIFCREFHPSKDNFVSDEYWLEKLRISSTQNPTDYDEENTRKKIEGMIDDNDNDDLNAEDISYLKELLMYTGEGEMRYLVYAHDNLPNGRDHEFVPYCKRLNPMLAVVFDAFDEICNRMKLIPQDKE